MFKKHDRIWAPSFSSLTKKRSTQGPLPLLSHISWSSSADGAAQSSGLRLNEHRRHQPPVHSNLIIRLPVTMWPKMSLLRSRDYNWANSIRSVLHEENSKEEKLVLIFLNIVTVTLWEYKKKKHTTRERTRLLQTCQSLKKITLRNNTVSNKTSAWGVF